MRRITITVVYVAVLASILNAQTAIQRWLHSTRPPSQHSRRVDLRRTEVSMINMQPVGYVPSDGPPPPPEPKWTQGLTAWHVAEGAWLLHKYPPYRD